MSVSICLLTSLRQLLAQSLKVTRYRAHELIIFVAFHSFDESIQVLDNRVGRDTALVGQLANQFAHRFVRKTGILPIDSGACRAMSVRSRVE